MIESIGPKQARDAYASRAEQAQATHRADAEQASRRADVAVAASGGAVHLSDGLRALQRAAEVVKQAPDVRADRVEALRRQIEAGQYAVSSEEIAAKMLGLKPSGER